MHSSIISYGLDIPSTNLLWNDKISFFYKNIGYSNNVINLDENAAEKVYEQLSLFEKENKEYKANTKYLMTLYEFLYNALNELFQYENKTKIYSFSKISKELMKHSKHDNEEMDDFRIKINKGEKHYLARFKELKLKDKEIKKLKEDVVKNKDEIKKIKIQSKKQEDDIIKKEKIIAQQDLYLKDKSNIINKQLVEIKKRKKENEMLKIQLNRYRNLLPIRVARKIKKIIKRIYVK